MRTRILAVILLLFVASGLELVFPVHAAIAGKGRGGYYGPTRKYNRENRFPHGLLPSTSAPNPDSNTPLTNDAFAYAPLIAVMLTAALLGFFAFREDRAHKRFMKKHLE